MLNVEKQKPSFPFPVSCVSLNILFTISLSQSHRSRTTISSSLPAAALPGTSRFRVSFFILSYFSHIYSRTLNCSHNDVKREESAAGAPYFPHLIECFSPQENDRFLKKRGTRNSQKWSLAEMIVFHLSDRMVYKWSIILSNWYCTIKTNDSPCSPV